MNQDYVFTSDIPVGPLPNLYIVADGMGGHNAGDYASRYTVNAVAAAVAGAGENSGDPARLLESALREANAGLREIAADRREYYGMGTTFVSASVKEGRLLAANVGDSRLYVLRAPGRIRQITVDHSFVEEMIQAGLKIAEAGFDINVHCIGDMAAHGLVKMTEALRDAGYHDTRVTDSHSTYIYKGDVPKFGELGILANTTYVWHAAFEEEKDILSPELPPMYELKSVLNGGGKVGAGSDYPTDDFGFEPMKGFQMGCTRKMYRDDIMPSAYELAPASEKLSMDDIITSYTISNAYQMRMEDKIGSIEVGKYADLIVLDQNVFEIPIEDVYKTRVCETIMNGETTYKR